ncbi:MAG TPA: TlpA disulfide reductase family protein [Candidatus Eremiobacteraceae bacterium]|nr:TlpA disulfide reductase family protein [Candidatus Eremiobacteraceae bacterium]
MKHYLAPALAIAAALALTAPARAAAPPSVGSLAPDFSLQTTAGHTFTLSSLRGHVVVVNFFATWCPPCRAETPDLVSLSRRYAGQNVVFVGIDDRERPALVNVWAQHAGAGYPLAIDTVGAVADRYDVLAIPTTYVLDPTGRVAYRQLDTLEGSTLSGVLDAVLAHRSLPESRVAQRFDEVALAGVAAVRADLAAGHPASAIAAGNKASDKMSALQSGTGSSTIDYWKATQESDALALAMADAYAARATGETGSAKNADLAQAALQQAQVASDRQQFADAYAAYANAVALDPSTASDAYPGMYTAAIYLKHTGDAVGAAKQLTISVPADPESWLTLESAELGAKDYPDALAAGREGIRLATIAYAKKPTDKSLAYELGRSWLKLGRVEIAAGNGSAASAVLRDASATAPGTIVAQQADEQYAALNVAPIAVSVSGSSSANAASSSPAKLWVVVRNPSPVVRNIDLSANGLPAHWLLSFCYAKVCQPWKSTISLAAGSAMRVELQVVPLADAGGPWTMHIAANGGPVVRLSLDGKALRASASVSASTAAGG